MELAWNHAGGKPVNKRPMASWSVPVSSRLELVVGTVLPALWLVPSNYDSYSSLGTWLSRKKQCENVSSELSYKGHNWIEQAPERGRSTQYDERPTVVHGER
jgi:hypothetical protein